MKMEGEEEIKDSIKSCEKSLNLFSNPGKPYTEIWVVREFLRNLGINFEDNELKTGNNPPDVIFRTAEFEIKELDKRGRKRHDEYKQKLEKAKSATSLTDLMTPYEFKEISLQEIVNRIDEKIKELSYSPDFCKSTNILFYINFSLIGAHCYIVPEKNIWVKWRSVSMVTNNNVSCVFWASNAAPEFIKSVMNKVTARKNPI